MKQLQASLLLAAALSFAAASVFAQAAKSPPAAGASASPSTPPTIASAIDREISLVEKEVVAAAEAMPEDKFDFSPEKLNLPGSDYKGVRTFGEQLKHIAASNNRGADCGLVALNCRSFPGFPGFQIHLERLKASGAALL